MADDDDVKYETAAKAEGTEPLCWDVGTLGDTLSGSDTSSSCVERLSLLNVNFFLMWDNFCYSLRCLK